MQVVENNVDTIYEIKKSTFLSYLTPINEFNSLHVKLKEKHPKAVHIVWACRYLNEFNQIVENSSDDGEPKGTSGPSILNVMRGEDLINAGIFVVRYFGGIKLGTGGLVRAYGTSAKMVIDKAVLKAYEAKEEFFFTCKYYLVRNLEHFLYKENVITYIREFRAEDVLWKMEITSLQKEKLLNFLEDFVRIKDAEILT